MNPIFIFLILWVISLLSIGQSCPADYLTMVSAPNLRQWNPAFTYSILSEEFNSFNTTVWGVRAGCVRNVDVEAQHYKNSPNNVSVSDSTLKLTARKETTWDWVYHQTGDPTWGQRSYTSGEIYTLAKTFGFGEFTIRCKFPVGAGSWAAFWMFGGFGLAGEANEIDFFEQYREDTSGGEIDNVIHWYYGGGGGCGPSKTSNEPTNVNNWHIYRCRWTPYEIKFYIDDLNNPVHKWSRYEIQSPQQYLGIENIVGGTNYVCNATYPMYPGEIILNYALYNGVSIDDTKLPQPFEIDYIKIRKFFLVPEITCPTIICSTGTASIEVDPAVTSITWALTPSNLFSGATTGSGTTANITASSCCQGKGKITYTYTIGNYGETFTAEKDIWIKGPDVTEVSYDVFRSDGVRATKVGSTFLLCPNTNYHIYLLNSSPVPLSNYNWIVPSAWTRNYTYNNMISVYTNSSPGGQVIATATNTASGCNNTIQPVTGYMGTNYSCGGYFMSFTPNPAISETTIELTADGEKVVNDKTEWELEVYDQAQSLKEKKTKLKGTQTKINTSGWKDGVYVVRAKIGDEVITEKLVVKH